MARLTGAPRPERDRLFVVSRVRKPWIGFTRLSEQYFLDFLAMTPDSAGTYFVRTYNAVTVRRVLKYKVAEVGLGNRHGGRSYDRLRSVAAFLEKCTEDAELEGLGTPSNSDTNK